MDMETLMAQAQTLQTRINKAQDSLANMHVKGIADSGAVIIDMTGKYDLISVFIKDDVMQYGAQKVSELVANAYKDAKNKADELIDKVMGDVTEYINKD